MVQYLWYMWYRCPTFLHITYCENPNIHGLLVNWKLGESTCGAQERTVKPCILDP